MKRGMKITNCHEKESTEVQKPKNITLELK
jgi:hypothetical protein